MKKNNIFIESHVLNQPFEGSSTYLINIYRKILLKENDKVFYFAANDIKNLKKYFGEFDNAKFIKYKFNNRIIRYLIEIPILIIKKDISFAHCTYILPFFKRKNCKYLLTVHDVLFEDFPHFFPFFYTFIRKIIFRRSAKNADTIFTISKYSRDRLSKHYNIDPKKIKITYCAVSDDIINFKYSKNQSKQFVDNKYGFKNYILYVSRIEKRKQQDILLKTYIKNKLFDLNLKLVFIGSPTLETNFDKLFKKFKQNSLADKIFWLEKISFNELLHLYNASELFVFPSMAEGFGIPPLEASCLNVPVLCSNMTAMSEFSFYDEQLSFNPSSSEDFNKKLVDICKNYALIDTVHIKSLILDKYSWEDSAKTVLQELC